MLSPSREVEEGQRPAGQALDATTQNLDQAGPSPDQESQHLDKDESHQSPPDRHATLTAEDTSLRSPVASLSDMPSGGGSPQDGLWTSVNGPQDEIVVGSSHSDHELKKFPPSEDIVDRRDIDMVHSARDQSASPNISPYPKRKRSSHFKDLSELFLDEDSGPRSKVPRVSRGQVSALKGVILGYWRDSDVPEEADKHAVIGFIDARDRLRTRTQSTSRSGKHISLEYPLPPGPGGSWVTFEKVVFDPHLVGLNQYQVKEFVRIRMDTLDEHETPEETEKLNKEAIKEAIERVRANPPPDTPVAPPIAYGPQLPPHVVSRLERKRRSAVESNTPPITGMSTPQTGGTPKAHPTRILLGHWKTSNAEDPKDKHAVYGILGTNGMLRVKLTRETRDGRPMIGNFPAGAGGLWINWDEIVFEEYLQPLSRVEIKEYCRIRERHLDQHESPDEKENNVLRAVREAQERAAGNFREPDDSFAANDDGPAADGNRLDPNSSTSSTSASATAFARSARDVEAPDTPSYSLRNGDSGPHRGPNQGEDTPSGVRVRKGLPNIQLRAANRPQSRDPLERTNSLARKEVARAQAAQTRADLRAASRETSTAANKNLFDQNIKQLNKVWAAQENNRLRAESEDVKTHAGVRYERKQTGPFQGKLVSQGSLISIDGEDYVEYRILTKPSFF